MCSRTRPPRLPLLILAAIATAATLNATAQDSGNAASKVDFSYAFAVPHRITIGRPSASDRTLLDLQSGSLRMAWTYDNLTMPSYPPLQWKTPPTTWDIRLNPQIDGKPFVRSRWTRLEKVLPALENIYEDGRCFVRLEAMGGLTAALIRVEVINGDSHPHQLVLRCDSISSNGAVRGENPAWVDWTRHTSATTWWPAGTSGPTGC